MRGGHLGESMKVDPKGLFRPFRDDWSCLGCGCPFQDAVHIHVLIGDGLFLTVACSECWQKASLPRRLRLLRRNLTRLGLKSDWPSFSAAVWAEYGGSPGLTE